MEDISYCRSKEHPCPTREEALSPHTLYPQMKFNPIMIEPGQSVTETILTICNQIKMKALVGVVISSPNQYVHLSLASVAYHFGIPIVDFSPTNYKGYYTTVRKVQTHAILLGRDNTTNATNAQKIMHKNRGPFIIKTAIIPFKQLFMVQDFEFEGNLPETLLRPLKFCLKMGVKSRPGWSIFSLKPF